MFVTTLLKNRRNFIPHVKTQSVENVDWKRLQEQGIKYLIFDKDNTLTRPYEQTYFSRRIERAIIEECASTFSLNNMAILSNSVGSQDDAPDYKETVKVEQILQLPVIRHKRKKPAVCDDVLQHFEIETAYEVAVVGDRVLSDVVMGNNHGFFTILVEPLDPSVENTSVKLVRRFEDSLLTRLARELRPPVHPTMKYEELESLIKRKDE